MCSSVLGMILSVLGVASSVLGMGSGVLRVGWSVLGVVSSGLGMGSSSLGTISSVLGMASSGLETKKWNIVSLQIVMILHNIDIILRIRYYNLRGVYVDQANIQEYLEQCGVVKSYFRWNSWRYWNSNSYNQLD
jgi:hypothetical protein